MARPKNARATARLNLIVEPQTKRIAFKLAFQRRISAGRLFEELVFAEKQRLAEAAQPESAT